MRLVVLIVLIVLAVWLIRRAFLASNKSRKAPPKRGNLEGDLVACARCGMHLPRNEAREAGGRLFCGEEHARLGIGP